MISTVETPLPTEAEQSGERAVIPLKERGRKSRFTPAMAAEMGRRSAAARRRKREERERQRLAALNGNQQKPAEPPPLTPLQEQIARLEKLMRALETQMDGLTNAVTFRDLSMAHARLFESWCVLTKTPKPGVLKVGRGARAPAPIAAFQEPQSSQTPQPVVNASDLVAPQPQAQTGTESIAP